MATNLVVVDNHKAEDAWNTAGGGLSVEGGTVRVAHAVLAGNQSSGLWAVDAAVELKHTLVAWNQWYGVRLEGDATVTARYCDLWGHQGGDWSGGDGPGDGGGNLAVDPQVLAFELGEDPWVWEVLGFDLHLAVDSPLVDAGDPAISDPDGSPADIGPYGGPGAGGYDADLDGYPRWWQPGPYEPGSYPALGWDCDDANDGVHPGSGC